MRPRAPLSWLDPGVFGTLGVGAGFALGAKLCRPESDVWLIYGDGAAGYSVAEFDTFVRHGTPVIAVVGNDAGWTQIAREQVEILQDDVACTLLPTDYHAVAAGFGVAASLSVIVLGDESGYELGDVQKVKLAAIEGEWETEPAPASFTVIGFPDDERMETQYAVRIPWAMGLIATRSLDKQVIGLKDRIL